MTTVCAAPSMRGPTGVTLTCERPSGHGGRHHVVEDGHVYEWGGARGATKPQAERAGVRVDLRLPDELAAKLDRLRGDSTRTAWLVVAVRRAR